MNDDAVIKWKDKVSGMITEAAEKGLQRVTVMDVPEGTVKKELEKELVELGYQVNTTSSPVFTGGSIDRWTYIFDISWAEQKF